MTQASSFGVLTIVVCETLSFLLNGCLTLEAIVLGDYLYIDGGERAYTPNGTATTAPGMLDT